MELNELLSESRKRRLKRRRTVWSVLFITAGAAVIAGILWLFLWSPFVRVDRIVAEGNADVPSSEIEAMAHAAFARDHHGFGFPGESNILMWPSGIGTSVLAAQPEIETATLSKDFAAHAIVVTVSERKPLAIWCFVADDVRADDVSTFGNEACYWFDRTGTLFAQTFDTEGVLLFAIHDYSQTGLKLGDQILPVRFLPNLLSILDVLRTSGLRLKEIRLNDLGLEEIQVTTYDGPAIYFGLRFPATNLSGALRGLVAKTGFGKLQYVDFRTQGRMFYR